MKSFLQKIKYYTKIPVSSHVTKLTKHMLLPNSLYVFCVTVIFYFFLWIINPSNKLIAASFGGLFLLLLWKLKDGRLSLLLTFLTSLVISTGKTYSFELIPPGVLPLDRWEIGYVVFIIVSAKHILSAVMALILTRDVILKKILLKIEAPDLLMVLMFAWTALSDFLASRQPNVSLSFTLLSSHALVLYFYFRAYLSRWKSFFLLLLSLFASILIFESFISFQQFFIRAPVGKNIEQTLVAADFGQAIDEIAFGFRSFGTFAHANELGIVLAYLLPILFSYFYAKPSYIHGLAIVVGFIALVLTLSRGAWIGIGAAMLYLLFFFEKVMKKKPPLIPTKYVFTAVCTAGIFFLFAAFPRLEKSMNIFYPGGGLDVRVRQIEKNLTLLALHPILGVGTQMNVPEIVDMEPQNILSAWPAPVHNAYMLIAVESGLPSLLLLFAFVIIYTRRILSLFHKQGSKGAKKYLIIGLLAGTMSLFVIALAQPALDKTLIVLSLVMAESIIKFPTYHAKNNS